jgi:5'(3')-deoxyribonucleotidase
MNLVFVDFDNTIAKTWIKFFLVYMQKYPSHPSLIGIPERDSLSYYDLYKYVDPTDEEIGRLKENEVFSTPGFSSNIPVMEYAVEALKILNRSTELYILTSPFWANKNTMNEKQEWLRHNMPFIKERQLILSNNKHIFHANSLLIDDNPKHLESFPGKIARIEYPYNADIKRTPDYSFNSWHDFIMQYAETEDTFELD